MGHTCSTVLIKCMDFRLTRDVYAWLEKKGLVNDCDMISVAGAAKDIVENSQGYVCSLIKLSIELHRIKKVILMQHMDCGAYGGSTAFQNKAEEIAKHKAEVNKAREIIAGQYPKIEIESYLVSFAEKGWRVEAI
jgi:carbonic anhydrase